MYPNYLELKPDQKMHHLVIIFPLLFLKKTKKQKTKKKKPQNQNTEKTQTNTLSALSCGVAGTELPSENEV